MKLNRLFLACFFVSGAAGLIYQVCWVRILSLVFGNTVYAVSMVVAGFLSGLAIGSHYWGKRTDAAKRPLRMYVLMEAGIAISALVVTLLITALDNAIVSVMTPESVNGGGWLIIRYVLVFIILLPPTMLMGGTLPVMGRMVTKNLEGVGLSISAIYAFNTYGAMAGSFLSGFILIPQLGIWGAIMVALCFNAMVAAVIWFTKDESIAEAPEVEVKAKSAPKQKKTKDQSRREDSAGSAPAVSRGRVLALFALAGFCSMAFEVLWTRAFVVSFKSTVYLFSNLLTVFLLGMAFGSWFFGKYLDKMKDPMWLFGLAEVGIGLLGLASIGVLVQSVDMAMAIRTMFGEMTLTTDAIVMFIVMAMTFALPTILMGLAYPLICRVTTKDMGVLGENMGGVYAIGTVGGIAGTLVSGFALIPMLGLQKSLIAVSGVAMVAGFIAILSSSKRKAAAWVIPASGFALVITIALTGIFNVNMGIGLKTGEKLIFTQEDAIGTVKVAQEKNNGPLMLLVNSYQLATTGDVAVRFGHMPMILKPDAEDVLVISLGSGITSGAVGGHPGVKNIDCVEIVPSLLEVQRFFEKDNHNITKDKRFHLTVWDGGHYVRMTKKKYDLVIADLFQPDSAGEGSLFTLEHFRNVKATLKPGGAMAQWLPMYQLSPENLKVILYTFATAFEHVTIWYGDVNSEQPTLLLMGSSEPSSLRPDKLAMALDIPAVKKDMIEAADPLSFLSFYITDRAGVIGFTQGAELNTDNRPVIEFTAPRYIWKRRENAVLNFKTLIDFRKKVTPLIVGAETDANLKGAIDHYFDARTNLLLGRVDHALSNYPSEYENYRKAGAIVPREPNLSFSVFDLGYLYYHRRDYQQSASMFQWATQANPQLPEAYFYLAKSLQHLGMKQEAMKAMQELARLHPEIAESLVAPPQGGLPPVVEQTP